MVLSSAQLLKCLEYLGMHLLPKHPLVALTIKTKLVASVYNRLSFCDTKPLPVTKSWEKDFQFLNFD